MSRLKTVSGVGGSNKSHVCLFGESVRGTAWLEFIRDQREPLLCGNCQLLHHDASFNLNVSTTWVWLSIFATSRRAYKEHLLLGRSVSGATKCLFLFSWNEDPGASDRVSFRPCVGFSGDTLYGRAMLSCRRVSRLASLKVLSGRGARRCHRIGVGNRSFQTRTLFLEYVSWRGG